MKYAAFFRGINVGGKNVVKMEELGRILSGLGLGGVKTYIQSGNAVFETDIGEAALQDMIRAGFAERFGFEGGALIRSLDEMRMLISGLPFTEEEMVEAEDADPQVEHLYVYFLEHPPEQGQLDELHKAYAGSDILRAGQRELYLLCRQSIRLSKLAALLSKRFASATVRNWKTVHKLYDMLLAL